MADFGSGLGAIIGGSMASNDLENALSANATTTNNGIGNIQPYNTFGQSFLDPAKSAISNVQQTADKTQGYNDFMAGYKNTPAAEYQLQQANAVQENSAAARGGLLSGSNLRALGTIDNGIVSQNANTAYNEYLAGNNQQFGQLTSVLNNMFQAIGVGTTATGQQTQLDTANLNATSYLGAAQAKNDQSFGAGFGSLFSGLSSIFSSF